MRVRSTSAGAATASVLPGLLVLGLLAGGVGWLAGCGSAARGAPASLSLSGATVPTALVTDQVRAMCAVARRAHTDPVGAGAAFSVGPHNGMHLLAAVLANGHKRESDALLHAMTIFERDLAAAPPPPSTGGAADDLVAAAANGLRALRVVPPAC